MSRIIITRGGADAVFKKAYLEITNICNASCSFCPGTGREKRMLTREEFSLLASRLRPHADFLYFHLMGEPLVHPLLGEFLDMADRLGFRVIITTNGLLLGERSGALLGKSALHKVNISLHSFEGGDGHDDYIAGCARFAEQCAASGAIVSYRLWNLGGREAGSARVRELLSAAHGAWRENARGVRLAERIFLQFGERFEWPDMQSADRGEAGFCYGLRDQVGVLCDGTVVPCCLDREGGIALGSLFEDSLEDILASKAAREIYDGFSSRKRTHALCRRCGYSQRFNRSE